MGGDCHSAGGVPSDGRGVNNFSHRQYEVLVGGAQLSKSRLGLNTITTLLGRVSQFSH